MQHTSRCSYALGPRRSALKRPTACAHYSACEGRDADALAMHAGREHAEAAARLGENSVIGPWRLLAAALVVGLSVRFAVPFTH